MKFNLTARHTTRTVRAKYSVLFWRQFKKKHNNTQGCCAKGQ